MLSLGINSSRYVSAAAVVAVKSSELPGLLRDLPQIIDELHSTEEHAPHRSRLYQWIVGWEDDVSRYNKELDDSFWIGVFHVILLILTFGCFDYRESCKLEGPLGSQFPKLFNVEVFKRELTVESFQSLPEHLQKQLSLLLKLSEVEREILLEEGNRKEDSLAYCLFLAREKTEPTLQGLLSFNSADYVFDRRVFQKERYTSLVENSSVESLIETLGLKTLTEEEVLSGKETLPRSSQISHLLPLLTKAQWEALPKPVFFLFILEMGAIVPYSFRMPYKDLQQLYGVHDPDLTILPALVKIDRVGGVLLFLLGHLTVPFSEPVLKEKIENLSAESLALLIKNSRPLSNSSVKLLAQYLNKHLPEEFGIRLD